MKFSGSSGVRMLWSKDLLDFAYNMSMVLGKRFGRVVVGGDFRTTSKAIMHVMSGALSASGADTYIAGAVPTPTLAFATQNFDIGVMITASHNPPEYNGIKLWNPDGSAVADTMELESGEICNWHDVGKIAEYDARAMHMNALIEHFDSLELRVVVDCANGAASVITPFVLRALGAEVITLNCHPSGTFPGHPSEPSKANLESLKRVVTSTGADLGIAHDGDADRFIAVTSSGQYLNGDYILAVFLKALNLNKIVAPVNSSMLLDNFAKVVRVKVGDANVSQEMKKRGVEFGGEVSGTQIFANWRYTPDAIYAALKFAKLAEKYDIDSIVSEFPTYHTLRKSIVYSDREIMEAKIERVVREYDNVNLVDGYRVELEGGWFLIRFSGTEPKVRITVEHADRDKAKSILARIVEALS